MTSNPDTPQFNNIPEKKKNTEAYIDYGHVILIQILCTLQRLKFFSHHLLVLPN